MSVKILHTSDWHVGRRIRGRDRSDEHRAVLEELVGFADENSVDLTVVAGDLFDTASPTPVAEQIVWSTLLDLAAVSPVSVVAGNHDNPARLDAVAPLLDMAGITVIGAPRSPTDGGTLEYDQIGVRLGLLPYVSQRGIVKAEDIMGSDPDQHAGLYEDRMRRVIAALTSRMSDETVNVFVGHLSIHGAEEGGGEHIFDYAIPTSVFPGHLSYVALGHYHRQQKMPHAGPVWYSGSPLQLDFGEVDDAKGALLVEASPGKPARVTSLPLSAGTRLVTLRGTLSEVVARSDSVKDAYVKVFLDEPARVGLAEEVREAIPGAVDVLLEAREPEGRETRPRRSLKPAEAFSRYLDERGVGDEALEELFVELLDEVAT